MSCIRISLLVLLKMCDDIDRTLPGYGMLTLSSSCYPSFPQRRFDGDKRTGCPETAGRLSPTVSPPVPAPKPKAPFSGLKPHESVKLAHSGPGRLAMGFKLFPGSLLSVSGDFELIIQEDSRGMVYW